MRILRDDENRLEFIVYPTKYFLIFMVFLIFFCVYGLFHPDTSYINSFFSIIFNINLSASQYIIAEYITTFALLLYLLSILIASCLIPIRVDIDKIAKKITYRYLAYHPIRQIGESTYKMIKVIPINDLKKLVYTNKLPEVPIVGIRGIPNVLGKYCFMLRDNSSVNVYFGIFSQYPHKYAFMKIAAYLKIPFENELGDETNSEKFLNHASNNSEFEDEPKSGKFSNHASNSSHLIRILLFILMGLILLLVLFVVSISLVGFLIQ
jgi:hypothetical protein